MSTIDETLLTEARKVQKNAYAPYSNFHVGAALVTAEGKIYSGCNVENTSYGLTICAERNAIFQMIADSGKHTISRILIIGDTDEFLPPCGACRQVIVEFSDENTVIIMCNRDGQMKHYPVKEVLPFAFFLGN